MPGLFVLNQALKSKYYIDLVLIVHHLMNESQNGRGWNSLDKSVPSELTY